MIRRPTISENKLRKSHARRQRDIDPAGNQSGMKPASKERAKRNQTQQIYTEGTNDRRGVKLTSHKMNKPSSLCARISQMGIAALQPSYGLT